MIENDKPNELLSVGLEPTRVGQTGRVVILCPNEGSDGLPFYKWYDFLN